MVVQTTVSLKRQFKNKDLTIPNREVCLICTNYRFPVYVRRSIQKYKEVVIYTEVVVYDLRRGRFGPTSFRSIQKLLFIQKWSSIQSLLCIYTEVVIYNRYPGQWAITTTPQRRPKPRFLQTVETRLSKRGPWSPPGPRSHPNSGSLQICLACFKA